jgi:hypothetical protein
VRVYGTGYAAIQAGESARLALMVNAASLNTSWLEYETKFRQISFRSKSITNVSVMSNVAFITGTGGTNGTSGCTFEAEITDSNPDIIKLRIRPGGTCPTRYNSPEKPLTSGNYMIMQ